MSASRWVWPIDRLAPCPAFGRARRVNRAQRVGKHDPRSRTGRGLGRVMLGEGALLALSFAMMIVGAFVFTNAVEWAGVRLDIGHGAVGSVLAAVATALPESLIPVVAGGPGGGRGRDADGAALRGAVL